MPETSHPFKPLDAGRVNPDDELELEYWCRELGCSEAALRAAVDAVGTHVAAVRERLSKAHGKSS
jgi:hypothetical protein